MARLSRKERERLMHKREILIAAEKCFANKGFHSTVMSEIAKEAEFSVGTLYQFFPSKEGLYFAILQEKASALDESIRSGVSKETSPVKKIDSIVETCARYFQENDLFFKIYLFEIKGYSWNIKAGLESQVMEKYKKYLTFLEKIFAQGIKKKLFEAIEPRFLAFAFQELLNVFIADWLTGPQSSDLEDHLKVFRKIFFDGVMARIMTRTRKV